ncbi:hypothetical protein A2V71_01790 [Candidatus Berkelbacteria bacterium RBG_13_40_8]|uniref:Methyltransferase type 11 domain-containing protein n=1 Tax=Candidatus Berkelbacteria bacterium RBG_13_40_8 TaxID=1797467 RepID=A0A1F5DPV0_9BACT|nr:MAG: hypothetical protein A2V71_01790 [Candidatus Berkelbacteria bacterium RBG_13_40_8]
MKRDILSYLCCPRDGSPVRLTSDNNREELIKSEELVCSNGHTYPITNSVPRFLVEEQIDDRQRQTMEVFSTQWRKFGQVTIDETAFAISRKWMFNRYGWRDEEGVRRFLKDKTMILDAGSASGRYANYFATISGNSVFGAEIGEGIEIAQANFGKTENLHFVQASITDLPFMKETFDFILCDGVLHHTSAPQDTFKKLSGLLKSDGEIAIYVYHTGNPLREFTDNLFIEALSRKSMPKSLAISRTLTELAQELAESNARVTVPHRLEQLDIDAGEYSLYDLLLWKIIKLHWDPDVTFEKNWSTNFGWFAPINAFRYTGDEVIDWFNVLGLEILHSDINQGGISIRAKKG